MTLPYEEQNAIKHTHNFLSWLLLSTKKERNNMPAKEFRRRVYACLRHYPADHRIDEVYKKDAESRKEDDRRIMYE